MGNRAGKKDLLVLTLVDGSATFAQAVNFRENRSPSGYLISDIYLGGYGPQAAIISPSIFAPLSYLWPELRFIRGRLFQRDGLVAVIDVDQNAKPTILKGANNGLDAIVFEGGSVVQQGSGAIYTWNTTRNEYVATSAPIDFTTVSAAARLDLTVTGDVSFTLTDLVPAVGKDNFLQQIREKIAALNLPTLVTVDFNQDGKFRIRTVPTVSITSIKEQVRFAESSALMTGAEFATQPAPASTRFLHSFVDLEIIQR